MTESVFIAWGKNEKLASKVEELLGKSGYFPTLGGRDRAANPTTFFINANVIHQMDEAAFAIILAQRIYDSRGRPTPEFRPNLMFEWGYLLRRLRADAIHVFLINLRRSDLPSDVLNAYTTEISFKSAAPPRATHIEAAAQEIVNTFLRNVVNIDMYGLEIIQHYDLYRSRLSDMTKRERSFNSREAGYYMLHMLQPAFYRDDLNFLAGCLTVFVRMSTGHFTSLAKLITQVIAYYRVTQELDAHGPSTPDNERARAISSLTTIERNLANVSKAKERVYNIFDVLVENFRGLTNFRLYLLNRTETNLVGAIQCFELAMKECSQFQSIYPANSGFIREFWGSYIERNLSRAYYLAGKTDDGLALAQSAESKRQSIGGQLQAAGQLALSRQFELELALSKFDQAINGTAEEADLLAIVNDYLIPHTPRGVDRVWERLHSALLKTADERKHANLTSALKALNR